jgi:serine/threonine protein kinase
LLARDLRELPDRNPEWVVDHSDDRTLVARGRPGSPVVHLYKIYEAGSVEDALREIRLGYQLLHEGIVQYADAGLDPLSGKPCVVMRYHAGIDLEQVVARHGALPLRAACRIAGELADILTYVHTARLGAAAPRGVVHCDVKPRNVIILYTTI